jgi:hypothetical protein
MAHNTTLYTDSIKLTHVLFIIEDIEYYEIIRSGILLLAVSVGTFSSSKQL